MAEDSSSEEDISKFEEAVDIKLTQAFSNNNASIQDQQSIDSKYITASPSLPSLRKTEREDNFSGDHRSLQVTPEFQKFVAKKLEKTLERYLNESEAITDQNDHFKSISKKKRKKTFQDSGIKLFKTSAILIGEFIQVTSEGDRIIQENNRKHIMRTNNQYNEKEELEKVKAAVVDPDFILNHKETKTWSREVKGEVIIVKKTSEENVFSIEPKRYIPPHAWTGRIIR